MSEQAVVDLATLRAAAEAATSGEWEAREDKQEGDASIVKLRVPETPEPAHWGGIYDTIAAELDVADARFIVAANPAVVLALVAEVEELRASAEFWRGLANGERPQVTDEMIAAHQAKVAHLEGERNRAGAMAAQRVYDAHRPLAQNRPVSDAGAAADPMGGPEVAGGAERVVETEDGEWPNE